MKRITYFAVLLVHLQCTLLSAASCKSHEWVYSYRGQVEASNTADSDLVARWTVAGNVTLQCSSEHTCVLKLDNLKTSLYNGLRGNIADGIEKEIPEDAKALLDPFIVHRSENGSTLMILHKPNEPLWSVNMKRAIASIFEIRTDKLDLPKFTTQEKTVHGDCEVNYDVENTNDEKIIYKIINHESCANKPIKHKSNVQKAPMDYEPIQIQTKRTYISKKIDNTESIFHVESSSNVTYKSMPSALYAQRIEQYQVFDLLSSSNAITCIDDTINTVAKNITYEFANDASAGRHKNTEKPQTEIIETFFNNYDKFKEEFHKYPFEHHDIQETDAIENMIFAFHDLSSDGLVLFKERMLEKCKNDGVLHGLALSLVPYIGNDVFIKYINDLLVSGTLEHNDYTATVFLVTYPNYMEEINVDTLDELKLLLSLNNTSNNLVKYTAVMSYGTLVAHANERGKLTKEQFNSYCKMFYDQFLDLEDLEFRIAYLLGLLNMGNVESIIVPIILNNTESRHIRSLAMYGLRKSFASNPEKVYENFWPIVQNESEHFEVRAAAMDVLLSVELTENQLNTIVTNYEKYHTDLHEQHLANYLLTTLKSLQNTTGYYDPLGALATSTLERVHIPQYPTTWTTGNYRAAYTDAAANHGAYIQARLVADPNSNLINVAHLTYSHFGMSLNLGTYTVYIKMKGIADELFSKRYFSSRESNDVPIAELLDIIQNQSYTFKDNDDFYFELVVFVDDRAIFGMHVDKHNIEDIRENRLYSDLMWHILEGDITLTFPVMDYTSVVSDLGTDIKIMNDMQHAWLNKMKNADKLFYGKSINYGTHYRSSGYSQTWVESYNPILDTTIASYKYFGEKVGIEFPVSFKPDYVFSWKDHENIYDYVWDNLAGTNVWDVDILKEYCPNCKNFSEILINVDEPDNNNWTLKLEEFGITLNALTITEDQKNIINMFNYENAISTYKTNSESFPLAKPLLFVWNIFSDRRYFAKELSRGSVRTTPCYSEPYETSLTFKLNSEGIFKDRNPIYGNNHLNVSLDITNYRLNMSDVLYKWNASYNFKNEYTPKSNIKETHTIQFNSMRNNTDRTMTIIGEIPYPKRKADKLSLEPVSTSIGHTTIIKADGIERITKETFKADNEVINKIKQTENYNLCLQDSIGLKYVPPTEACISTHKALSQYDDYELIGDYDMILGSFATLVGFTKFENYVMMQMHRADDNKLSMHFSPYVLNIFAPVTDINTSDMENYLNFTLDIDADLIFPNPTSIAYDDFDITLGFTRTCILTPTKIKSFSSNKLSTIKDKADEDIIAFIECTNHTRSGMTVQHINDKHIGFTLWSGENKIIATKIDDKLHVTLNGQHLQNDYTENKKFMVHFLNDDVIYVADSLFQVYYNTEYISIKAFTAYNNFICGYCSLH